MKILLATALLSIVSFSATAADSRGSFAVKGAGLQTCKQFIDAWQNGADDLKLYAGWIEGYVSGINQHNKETYDAAPWPTTETLMGMAKSACHGLPDGARFLDAISFLQRQLWPTRLKNRSELIGVQHGKRAILVYQDVLEAAKTRLKSLGFDPGPLEANFNAKASDAFRAFQEAHGLESSGLPDQRTLVELFLKQRN